MKVAVIMGSISDEAVAEKVTRRLAAFDIEYEVRVLSAHRAITALTEYCEEFADRGITVAIAIAGKAAHLAGVVAGLTIVPVIAVPVKTSLMGGMDSLLSVVQMPSGVPVATVAIDGGENAAILAAQILAVGNDVLKQRLYEHKNELTKAVFEMEKKLSIKTAVKGNG